MLGSGDGALPELDSIPRAVSSVVGVAMMIVIVVLVASLIAGVVITFGDGLNEPKFETDETSVNPWSHSDSILVPKNPTAGAEDVRYRVEFKIMDPDMNNESLNDIEISVSDVDNNMFSGVSDSEIQRFDVQTTDADVINLEDAIEDDDEWDLDKSDNELEIEMSGSNYPNPSTGDVITIIYDGVDNPNDPGTYNISVQMNEGEDEQHGELRIIDS